MDLSLYAKSAGPDRCRLNAHDRASGGTCEHAGVGSWHDRRPHADRGLLGKQEQVVPTERN